MDADSDRDIEVVDDAISIQILKAKVRGKDDRSSTKHVDQSVGGVVLKLSAKSQLVFAEGHRKAVTKLISI